MNVVAFDTETHGLDSFDESEQAFLGSWADSVGEWVADLSDANQAEAFTKALLAADVLVCHNLSFDVHQVRNTLGFDPLAGKQWEDTDIISRVLHPEGQRKGERGGHGLKNLATVYLRADAKDAEDRIKEMGKSIGLRTLKKKDAYYDVWRAYPTEMERYAALDARYTYDLYMKWKDEADASAIYQLEKQVMPILIDAEERGVTIDIEAAVELRKQYHALESKLYTKLTETIGEDAITGEGSEDALLEALTKMGVPLHKKTPTGKLSTAKFALQEFEDDYPVLADLMEFRRVEKFLSTYLDPMVESGGIMHTSFYQCSAWTGRMSSSRPNLQNLPKRAGKEVRRPIIPREGYALISCDYDAIETRIFAYYMNDRKFIELIRDGHDPYAWMAANVYGGSMEEYVKGAGKEALRNQAKATFLAILYGAGAPRVADMNKISIPKARGLVKKFKGTLPGWQRLSNRVREKIEVEGHVTTLLGRKQPVNKSKSYVGLNALIQGTAADIMKQGLVNIESACKDMGASTLLVVHDEWLGEAPVRAAASVCSVAAHAMETAATIDPPLVVSVSVVTTNYADA